MESVIIYTVVASAMAMREWRNWQTRTFEGRVVYTVRVQVPFLAPAASCRPQLSGGDIKNPNFITRWWGSDLSLFTAPTDVSGTR